MKRAPRSRQRHDLYAKYHDYDSEISDLLGECGIKLYMRLLDAADDGAEWAEAVNVLFGIDPVREPERARQVHDSHLGRARWMTQSGYRQLLRHPTNRT
jgi:hypothetical protein